MRAELGEAVDVIVRRVPELDEAFDALRDHLGAGEAAPGFLSEGGVSSDEVGSFFRAAARLWRRAPWGGVSDSDLLQFECEGVIAGTKCLSIIGNLGESFGVLVFDSVDDWERMAKQSDAMAELAPGERFDLGFSHLAITFDRGDRLAAAALEEIVDHGWEIAGDLAYPGIMHIDPDLIVRPLTREDLHLATAVAEAVELFFESQGETTVQGVTLSVADSFMLSEVPGNIEARITAPHPDVPGAGEPGHEAVAAAYANWSERTVVEFLAVEKDRGRDEAWLREVAALCHALLGFYCLRGDVLQTWTAKRVEEFMVEFAPAELPLLPLAIEHGPEILAAFFAWLEGEGHLPLRNAAAIQKRIAGKASRFRKSMSNEDCFSPIKRDAVAMLRAGINPQDTEAVDAFLAGRRAGKCDDIGPHVLALRLRVTLEETVPPVWRRIVMPLDADFMDLHQAIQNAMGWEDAHLFQFEAINPLSGMETAVVPMEDEGPELGESLPAEATPIASFLGLTGSRVDYTYDFGDNWRHRIELEKVVVITEPRTLPCCVGGERAGPPEDCGGVWGYRELVAGNRPEEWEEIFPDGFDAAAFSPDEVDFFDAQRVMEG